MVDKPMILTVGQGDTESRVIANFVRIIPDIWGKRRITMEVSDDGKTWHTLFDYPLDLYRQEE